MGSTERLSYLHGPDHDIQAQSLLVRSLNPCKNLENEFDNLKLGEVTEHLKVYLRVRPILEKEEQSEYPIVTIDDDTQITLNPPLASNTFKNITNGISQYCHKFSFSNIYGPKTTQQSLFEETSAGMVDSFLAGENCLLFTYGATSSGKTYTIQGTPSDPGILPRTLDTIFSYVGKRHYPRNDLKPKYFCNVVQLDKKDIKKELDIKESIFKSVDINSTTLSQSVISLQSNTSQGTVETDSSLCTLPNNSNSVVEDLDNDDETVFALFVSFHEIYNDSIFDLLDRNMLNKRKALGLGEDRNGAIYVKGLVEVRVNSAQETLRLLEIGRQNLHFAATKLNHNSSRSHCIFTFKLIRLANSENPNIAKMSMLSVTDLAGAERSKKTKGCQERVKEAGNINTSLLSLGRCITALRKNQFLKGDKKKEVPVPYRDSKLTRLFQSFFLGQGKAAMIVNISQSPYIFDETLQVLKFAAVAKQVTITQIKPKRESIIQPKKSSTFAKFRQSLNSSRASGRLSVPWANSSAKDVTFGGPSPSNEMAVINEDGDNDVEEEEEEDDEYCEELLALIKKLKDELVRVHQEKQTIEARVRKEVCSVYNKQIVQIEKSWQDRVDNLRENTDLVHKVQIDNVVNTIKKTDRVKRRRSLDESERDMEDSFSLFSSNNTKDVEDSNKIYELESEKKMLEEELRAMKSSIRTVVESSTKLKEENSKITFQLAKLTSSYDESQMQLEKCKKEINALSTSSETKLNEELNTKIRDMNRLLDEKELQLSDQKETLMEAVDEYLIKQNECSKLMETVKQQELRLVHLIMNKEELETQVAESQQLLSEKMQLLDDKEDKLANLQECISQNRFTKVTPSVVKQLEEKVTEQKDIISELKETHLKEKSKLLLQLSASKPEASEVSVKELKVLEEKLKSLTCENDKLSEENKRLVHQMSEKHQLVEDGVLEEARQQIKSMSNQISKLEEDNEKLSKKISDVENKRAAELMDLSMAQRDVFVTHEQIQNTTQELQDLKETKEQLYQQISCEEKKNSELNSKITKLEHELEKLFKQNEEFASAQIKNSDTEDKIKQIQHQFDQLSLQNQKLVKEKEEFEIIDLENKEKDDIISDLKDTINKLNEKLTSENHSETFQFDLLAEKAIADENLEKLQKEKEEELEILKSKITVKDNELDTMKHKLKELNNNLEEYKTTTVNKDEHINQLNELENRLMKQIQSEKDKLLSCTKDLDDSKQKIDNNQHREDTLKKELTKQSEIIESITKERDSIKQKCEEIESNKHRLEEKLENMNNETCNMKEQLTDHTQLVNKHDKDIKEYQDKISSLESKITAMKNSSKEANEEWLVEKERLDQQSKELENLRNINNKNETEKDVTIKKLNETKSWLQDKLCEVEQENATLKKDVDESSNSQIDQLMIQNRKLKDEMKLNDSLLKERINDKETTITSLNEKIKKLDLKLSKSEESQEVNRQKLQKLEDQLLNSTSSDNADKLIILEKELAALKEARREQTDHMDKELKERDIIISEKTSEIDLLQAELKKLLQVQCQPSTFNNTSIKDENTGTNIQSLQDELGKSEQVRRSQASEINELKKRVNEALQMNNEIKKSMAATAIDFSHDTVAVDDTIDSVVESIASTKKRGRSKKKVVSLAESENSDAFITPVATPAKRKGRPPRNKVEAEDVFEASHISILKTANTTTRKSSRKSKKPSNLSVDFEYPDIKGSKSCSRGMSSDNDESNFEDEDKGRKSSRTRTSRNKSIYSDQESSASKDKENKSSETTKTPRTRKKKHQLFTQNDEPYLCSPNVNDAPGVAEDSPHTVVKRQLRKLKK